MAKIPHIVDWKDCEWKKSREKICGKCFQGNNMTLQLGQIWPGHEKRPHRHEYEQIAMIFTGECNFYVDGVAYHLTGGCVMSIPSNAEHYIEVIGNDPVYALDIFWPKRPDRVESVPDKPFLSD